LLIIEERREPAKQSMFPGRDASRHDAPYAQDRHRLGSCCDPEPSA
jgi:hypothetical protein